MDVKVYEELLHSFVVQAMVDGTPGPGHCALACVRRRVPYLGLCLSDDHAALLMKRIVYLVFQEMKQEDSILLEPAWIKIFKDSAENGQGESSPEAKKQRSRQGRQTDTDKGAPAKKPRAGLAPKPGPEAGDNAEEISGPDSENSDAGED